MTSNYYSTFGTLDLRPTTTNSESQLDAGFQQTNTLIPKTELVFRGKRPHFGHHVVLIINLEKTKLGKCCFSMSHAPSVNVSRLGPE